RNSHLRPRDIFRGGAPAVGGFGGAAGGFASERDGPASDMGGSPRIARGRRQSRGPDSRLSRSERTFFRGAKDDCGGSLYHRRRQARPPRSVMIRGAAPGGYDGHQRGSSG